MRTFFVYVDGEPVAKGRPRGVIRYKGVTPYVHMHTPEKTAAAEQAIWAHFKSAYPGLDPIDEPFALTLRFFEGRRQAEKQQDLDNLSKTVLDALNGHAWGDDRLCHVLTAVIVRGSTKPHTEIDIRTLTPSEIATSQSLEAAAP